MTKKILIAVLSVTMLTAAKCKDGEIQDITYNSPMCGQVTSVTISYLGYGDGKMMIVPITEVERGSVFVVGLLPRDEFKDATVTVSGAVGGWIGGSGTYDSALSVPAIRNARFIEAGCVPPTATVGDHYKYMVEIVKVFPPADARDPVTNTLDPRAKVVN